MYIKSMSMKGRQLYIGNILWYQWKGDNYILEPFFGINERETIIYWKYSLVSMKGRQLYIGTVLWYQWKGDNYILESFFDINEREIIIYYEVSLLHIFSLVL